MKRLLAALACTGAGLLCASAASATTFGVTEDEVKARPGYHHAALVDLGMRENAISVTWNPDNPLALPWDAVQIDQLLRVAAANRVRMAFAIYQRRPVGLSSATSPILLAQFGTWLQHLARRFPSVKEYIGPNEPNQPRFWRPQFDNNCVNVSGASYARVMATMYDALKSVNGDIEVVGIALSPRGNDNCLAPNNVSTSPVRFLHHLGREYRRSRRNRPLMDSFSFHPYPRINTDDPMTGYRWPNIGVANFDRLKQAIHDTFAGTAQPTVEQGLKIRIHESGHETQTAGLAGYHGREEVPPVDEDTQARYYVQLIRHFVCDPSVDSLNFFHLIDEADRGGLQSGLLRRDGTRKPSYAAVKTAIAEANERGCTGQPVRWAPSATVVGAHVTFEAGAPLARVSTEEEAAYSAGVFRVSDPLTDAGRTAIARSLASVRRPATAVVSTRGTVRAYYQTKIRTPGRRLAPGAYVYALKLTATTNPARASVFISEPFNAG